VVGEVREYDELADIYQKLDTVTDNYLGTWYQKAEGRSI
jgi:hypothetical protein